MKSAFQAAHCEREYFKTEFEAEQSLRNQGYTAPINENSDWTDRTGLVDATIRCNGFGYFITYLA